MGGAGRFRIAFKHVLPGHVRRDPRDRVARHRRADAHPGRAVVPRPRLAAAGARARRDDGTGPQLPVHLVVGAGVPGARACSSSRSSATSPATPSVTSWRADRDAQMILVRIGSLLAVLLVLTMVVFLIQSVLPADPVRAAVGGQATQEVVDAKRHELGYDQPLPQQYVNFLGDVVQGDFGDSLRTRRPVLEDISKFAPATLELAFTAALLAGMLGVILGLWSAHGGRGSGDRPGDDARALVGARVLPGDPADPALLPEPRLAAGVRPHELAVLRYGADRLPAVRLADPRQSRAVVGRGAAPRPAGVRARARSGGGDRPGAAQLAARRDAPGPRAHRAGQGPVGADGGAAPRAAQRLRARALDGRACRSACCSPASW